VKASLHVEERSVQLLSFFKRLLALDRTIILTVEKGAMREEILAPFREAAQIYIETSINKIGGIVNRVAFIRRFANAQGRIDNSIVFRVEAGTGIILEIMAVS